MERERETWRLLNRRTLIEDPWLEVYEDNYELPDGTHLEGYHSLQERDSVIIVALTEHYEVLMVRQYRPGMDAMVNEVAAGFLEKSEEDVLERAKAELREETGYASPEWYALGALHDMPARIRKTTYCFLALNARKEAEQQEDSTEFVRYKRIPLPMVQQMIREGQVSSATTIAAMFKALLMLERLSGQADRTAKRD